MEAVEIVRREHAARRLAQFVEAVRARENPGGARRADDDVSVITVREAQGRLDSTSACDWRPYSAIVPEPPFETKTRGVLAAGLVNAGPLAKRPAKRDATRRLPMFVPPKRIRNARDETMIARPTLRV
jgi:hypothetical protein